jgi:hypothetical protein
MCYSFGSALPTSVFLLYYLSNFRASDPIDEGLYLSLGSVCGVDISFPRVVIAELIGNHGNSIQERIPDWLDLCSTYRGGRRNPDAG